MKHAVITLATTRPRLVFALTVALLVIAGIQVPRIAVDTDPENMLPADQPDRVFHNEVERRFGLHDAIVVGMVNERTPDGIYNPASLGALHALTEQILAMDGVVTPDTLSLATADNITQGDGGQIRFAWLMREAPRTREAAADIRAAVERLPLLVNTLVSADGHAAAVYVPIESKDLSYPLSLQIRAAADALATEDDFHITGLPVAEDTFGHEMFVQMAVSAPLAGLMIFLLMWYFFRSVTLVLAPMIVAIVTVTVTMGLLIGLGFTVHIMSSMIPIFLMPIAVVDSVHIMSEFADRYDGERPAAETAAGVVEHLFRPMLFTSLTTTVGFASLLLTPIPPVQIFGAFVAFGVLIAFLVTIVFIPAYVARLKPKRLAALRRLKPGSEADTPLARLLRGGGRFATRFGKAIIAGAALLMAVSVAGILHIEINDNPVRWFKETHRIRVADAVLNRHFAGTYDAFLVLDHTPVTDGAAFAAEAGAMLDEAAAAGAEVAEARALIASPGDDAEYYGRLAAAVDDALFAAPAAASRPLEALLARVEAAQSESKYFQRPGSVALIEELQAALMAGGGVGKTSALPDVVKIVNRELHGGGAADYAIPATAAGVAQTLLQFQSSHRPGDLWHMVTPDFRSAAIWLQLASGDNQDMTRVMAGLDDYLATHPLPQGVEARWAGKTYINVVWQDEMVAGMLNSLLGAFVVVFVMMSLLFRSLRFGLLAMVPLTLTIVGVYGLIGWMGKDYDMPIAVLSSLTLGLSVDFAIHFLERLRELHRQTGDLGEALVLVFEEPARAISRNAIVIALGFTPLFMAPLVPYVTVGAFMVAIMLLSGLATLLLLPAVISRVAGPLFRVGVREDDAGGTAATAEGA
jgi:predicted RND superfamily exporter protein